MFEDRTSKQSYSLNLLDGSQLILDLKNTSFSHQIQSLVGKQHKHGDNKQHRVASRSDLRPWQRISIRASRIAPSYTSKRYQTKSTADGRDAGSSLNQLGSLAMDPSHGRRQGNASSHYKVHELTVLPLDDLEEEEEEEDSGQEAIGLNSSLKRSSRHRHRGRSLQQYSGAMPYSIPSLPYHPTIIFALINNCGGPLPASTEDMSRLLFGTSSDSIPGSGSGSGSARKLSTSAGTTPGSGSGSGSARKLSASAGTSFAGWNNACSYGQVNISRESVEVLEVRLI